MLYLLYYSNVISKVGKFILLKGVSFYTIAAVIGQNVGQRVKINMTQETYVKHS